MDDDKTQQININLDKNAIAGAWRLIGATDLVMALKEVPGGQKAPGFGHALAIAECEMQKLVGLHQGRVLRLAFMQGIDLTTHHIMTSGEDGLRVYAVPMDLVDRTEVE